MKKKHDIVKRQKRYVFLDDIRMPEDVLYYINDLRYEKLDWVIVRSYDEFVNDILCNGLSDIYSFDHDLADEHYGSHLLKKIDYDKFNEKTGYSCAKWLVEYCLDNDEKLPEYLLHTMNNVGAVNIDSYFKNYLKFVKNQL